MKEIDRKKLAYLIGLAIGDGNLTNPNGRATRLRITCDNKYPHLIENIALTMQELFPKNKVSFIHRKDNCVDISCYSNGLEKLLGWRARHGSKFEQKVSVPLWILENNELAAYCLRGLFETDGSVYNDRGYVMVNFVTIIPILSENVSRMISNIGFSPNIQVFHPKTGKTKYTIRISKNSEKFLATLGIDKS